MGACVSIQKDPNSTLNFRLYFRSKTDTLVIPSPLKDDKPVIDRDRTIAAGALKSQWSPSHPVMSVRVLDSEDETFFDSRAWIDSDCEDDFFSVNGDFTPSRGSTPLHPSFSPRILPINKAIFDEISPEPSPTEKKKTLIELFRDSVKRNQDMDEQNIPSNQKELLSLKGENGTPFDSGANSVSSSERTLNANFKFEEKSTKSVHCCLPGMLSSRSFIERKKKMSPAHTSTG